MNAQDQLKQLIRRMVKEEVAAEVSKAMGKVLVEMVKEIKNTPNAAPVITEEEEVSAPILKTNNPKLNGVLAETARNYKPLPRTADGASLVELMGGFEKIGKHETVDVGQPKTKIEFLKRMVNESVQPPAQSVLDAAPEELPAGLQNIFKKDFKAILNLSKSKRGGFSPNVSFDG
jgi:hypothetical protein